MNHVSMLNLFLVLLTFTIFGYKKKIFQSLSEVERMLGTQLPDISTRLNGYQSPVSTQDGMGIDTDGTVVYHDFRKSTSR